MQQLADSVNKSETCRLFNDSADSVGMCRPYGVCTMCAVGMIQQRGEGKTSFCHRIFLIKHKTKGLQNRTKKNKTKWAEFLFESLVLV